MERYSWIIALFIIACVSLIGFFGFLFKDMGHIKRLNKPKLSIGLNVSLIAIALICVALSIYLYLDIQEQLRILGTM